jgi:hypothetical protein
VEGSTALDRAEEASAGRASDGIQNQIDITDDLLWPALGVVDEFVSPEITKELLVVGGRHRDDAGSLPLGQPEGEAPYAACGPVDEDGLLAVQGDGAVRGRLERRRMVVAQLDQELPSGQSGHGDGGRLFVLDPGWFAREVGGGAVTYSA